MCDRSQTIQNQKKKTVPFHCSVYFLIMGSTKKNLFDDNDASSSSSDTSGSDSSCSSSSSPKTTTKKHITDNHDDNGDNNDGNIGLHLTINKTFATKYQAHKQREELQQIRQRKNENVAHGGHYASSSDASSDEEEDENAALFTSSVNVQFLKTIKALRKKDDSIYDPSSQFFGNDSVDVDVIVDEENDDDDANKIKEPKPRRYKDIVRDQILEQIEDEEKHDSGKITSTDIDSETTSVHSRSRSKFAYDEQQDKLRKAFLNEGCQDNKDDGNDDDDDNNNDDDDDGFMVIKKKSLAPDTDRLGIEAIEQLKEIETISKNDDKKDVDVFHDPRGEVQDGGKFLLDFITKKKWIDTNDIDRDRVEDEKENEDESSLEDVDRADDYEAQYNFRFEQAARDTTHSGANFSVQTYARGQTMNTVRRPDLTRKDKRQARKERKAKERKAKEEQLKRLKNAKKQEMNEKLSKVRSVIGGAEENAIDEAVLMKMLEGDYDPEELEKSMKEAYGENFYKQEDNEWKTDLDVRQTLNEDDEGEGLVGQDDIDGGMYDNIEDEGDGETNENTTDDLNYDESEEWADYNDDDAYYGSQKDSGLENKIKAKLQEELYKLDYEDIVAGQPTRFKYRKVESNDYGVTTQEILFARDNTLKQFVSLKKMAPYNNDGEYNAGSKKRRKFREMLKQDLEAMLPPEDESLDDDASTNSQEGAKLEETKPKKKRRRLKKGKKKPNDDTSALDSNKTESLDSKLNSNDETTKRRRKKNKKNDLMDEIVEEKNDDEIKQQHKKKKKKKITKRSTSGISNSRLASYGL